MKAVQIKSYSKNIDAAVCEIPQPEISDSEVLIKVKAAAVNPVELLILTGSVKLIQDYKMPLTLGNECAGVVSKVGKNVTDFQPGDAVYTRLPLHKIGAFAEFVAVDQKEIAKMPEGYDFATAAAIPLTGLTAYQAIVEELEAKPGETVLIPGGSGSFGQMAVPIAKALGLRVIVTGNARAREQFLAMGVDQYLDYKKENYWERLSEVDHVIDTLGPAEFEHELSVLKTGGRLVSLRTGPIKPSQSGSIFPVSKSCYLLWQAVSMTRPPENRAKNIASCLSVPMALSSGKLQRSWKSSRSSLPLIPVFFPSPKPMMHCG